MTGASSTDSMESGNMTWDNNPAKHIVSNTESLWLAYFRCSAVILSGPHALFVANFSIAQYLHLIWPNNHTIVINHTTNLEHSTRNTVKNPPKMCPPQLSDVYIPRDPINTRWQRHLTVIGKFHFFPELKDITLLWSLDFLAMEFASSSANFSAQLGISS